jgi:hypothetical protein
MRDSALKNILGGILLLLAQVFILKNMMLFDSAFCFAYILVLLLISIEVNGVIQMIMAFFIGLFIDLFYHTPGLHAAASVLVVFVKVYWIALIVPSGGYETASKLNIHNQGIEWFLTYSYPLILIHSITLLFLEAAGVAFFWSTLLKAFYTSLFTLAMVLIIQYLFYKKSK